MKTVESLGGVVLRGRFVALEPFAAAHRESLIAAAQAPGTFTYMPYDMSRGYGPQFDWHMGEVARGAYVSYAVRRLRDGVLVGATSYLAIAPEHARVEIGSTWYAPEAQASAVNPEAKYLLLGNAFAKGWNRVEFKTDSRNARSRAAIAKLGATQDGIMRAHMWMPKGYWRDSVYFSILASEWAGVKARLEERIATFE
jgi:RimJ/RimL family protein N-acetyltransferase